MVINNKELLSDFYKHEKLNVAISTDIFFPTIGGVSFTVDSFAKALIATGKVNVVVITGEVKGHKDQTTYPVIRVKSVPIPKRLGDSLPIPNSDGQFKKLLEKLKLDVVDVQTVFGISTFLMNYAKKKNIPIIFHGHSKFEQEYKTIVKFLGFYKVMARRAFKIVNRADLVLPISISTMQHYLQHNVKSKMEVLYLASDMKEFTDREKAFTYLNKDYNVQQDDNVLVFVSRLEMECKNISFLLDSLKRVKEKGVKVKTFIIGNGKDYNRIKDRIEELDLQKEVFLTGEIRDREILSYFYIVASLNVFPSVIDTYGLIVVEAGIQGTPSLVIKNTGISESLTDNETGFLEDEDVEKYSDRIIEVLSDKENLKKVGDNAKKSFSGGWNKVAEKCIEYYNREIELKKSTK